MTSMTCHDIHDLSWYSQLLLSWYQWCLCHDIHDLSCVVSGHGIHDIHDVRSHDIHDVRSHDRTDLEYWKVWRSLGKCWKVLQSLEKEPSHGHALKLDFESRFKTTSSQDLRNCNKWNEWSNFWTICYNRNNTITSWFLCPFVVWKKVLQHTRDCSVTSNDNSYSSLGMYGIFLSI